MYCSVMEQGVRERLVNENSPQVPDLRGNEETPRNNTTVSWVGRGIKSICISEECDVPSRTG